MGFIYSKPLSIEGVFSKFDTDGNGKISKKEAKAAKNMDVFTNFKVKQGMTLENFENTNRDAYAGYEKAATGAYNRQAERIKLWLEFTDEELSDTQAIELKELEILEKELEKEKEELEQKLSLQKDAVSFGFEFSADELNKLSVSQLKTLLQFRMMQQDE